MNGRTLTLIFVLQLFILAHDAMGASSNKNDDRSHRRRHAAKAIEPEVAVPAPSVEKKSDPNAHDGFSGAIISVIPDKPVVEAGGMIRCIFTVKNTGRRYWSKTHTVRDQVQLRANLDNHNPTQSAPVGGNPNGAPSRLPMLFKVPSDFRGPHVMVGYLFLENKNHKTEGAISDYASCSFNVEGPEFAPSQPELPDQPSNGVPDASATTYHQSGHDNGDDSEPGRKSTR